MKINFNLLQTGKKAGWQASTRKAFSLSHALEGLVELTDKALLLISIPDNPFPESLDSAA